MLQKMERIQVIGPKEDLGRVVDVLYRAGTLHLEDAPEIIPKAEISLDRIREDGSEDIASVLGRINAIFSTLPVIGDDPGIQDGLLASLENWTHPELVARAREIIGTLETTTRDLSGKKAELTLSITTLNRYAKVLAIIQPVEKELPALTGFEVTILLIQAEHREVLSLIGTELSTITGNRYEMSVTPVDAETLAAIMVFPKRYSEDVHSFIYSVNVNEVRLPSEFAGRPFYEMYALIEEKKIRAQEEIARIDKEFLVLSNTWYQELVVLKRQLEMVAGELDAYRNFGLSEYTFVVMGWIPKKYLKKTKKAVKETFGDRVVVHTLPVTEKDLENAPVFYDNPWWVKPFEFIMQLVAPPRYREVDPSPILAIFFPLFFGIMVGDIGYGLIILAFALVIRYRFKAIAFAKNLADILIISSIPTIFFGFLFGELFGDLGETMGWLHPMQFLGITWNRVDAMIPMLIFAIAIGVIHVFLGLLIGIRNAVILKKRKHLFEKSGMLLVITGPHRPRPDACRGCARCRDLPGGRSHGYRYAPPHRGCRGFRDDRGDEHGGKHPLVLPADGDRHGLGDPRNGGKPARGSVRDRHHRSDRRGPAPHAQRGARDVLPLDPLGSSPPRGVLLEVLRGGRGGVPAVQKRGGG